VFSIPTTPLSSFPFRLRSSTETPKQIAGLPGHKLLDPISIMVPLKLEPAVIVVTLGELAGLPVPEAPGPSPTIRVPVGSTQFAPSDSVIVPAGSKMTDEGAVEDVKPAQGLAEQLLLWPGLIPRASMTPAPV
jgi:hypothetical protein